MSGLIIMVPNDPWSFVETKLLEKKHSALNIQW